MAEKAKMTIGIYAGIMNPDEDGKLLLRRRVGELCLILER